MYLPAMLYSVQWIFSLLLVEVNRLVDRDFYGADVNVTDISVALFFNY